VLLDPFEEQFDLPALPIQCDRSIKYPLHNAVSEWDACPI
jgi:hypothetical protein